MASSYFQNCNSQQDEPSHFSNVRPPIVSHPDWDDVPDPVLGALVELSDMIDYADLLLESNNVLGPMYVFLAVYDARAKLMFFC